MNPHDIPVAGPVDMFFWNAIEWLYPIANVAGLVVGIWAFRYCRKCGYLIVGFYFALALFSSLAMPSINRAIREYRAPDISEQTQRKMQAAAQQAMNRVLEEEGHPIVASTRTYHFPFGSIVLVVGFWLIAKREVQEHRSDKGLQQSTAPTDSSTVV